MTPASLCLNVISLAAGGDSCCLNAVLEAFHPTKKHFWDVKVRKVMN